MSKEKWHLGQVEQEGRERRDRRNSGRFIDYIVKAQPRSYLCLPLSFKSLINEGDFCQLNE